VVEGLDGHLPAMTPRAVIKAFNKILREADLDFADEGLELIDSRYALDHLALDDEESE
jgi:hypothetical protein